MRKINDLGELLAGLTKLGKAELIASLVGVVEIPASDILESIDVLTAEKNYETAARIAEEACINTKDKAERKEYALAVIKLGKLNDTDTALESAEFVRNAGFPELALETYESWGYFDCARAAAEEAGLKDKAELYSRIEKILEESD